LLGSAVLKLSKKKVLYIIPDTYTEMIPFELSGKDSLLVQKYRVYFMPSIASAFKRQSPYADSYYLEGNASDMWYSLDKAVLNRSGLKNSSDKNGTYVFHIAATSNEAAEEIMKKNRGTGILYLARVPISGYNASVLSAGSGRSSVLVSSPFIRDVNVSLFAGEFYTMLHKGQGVNISFTQALKMMLDHQKFGHPSYWAGIRLYVNGLEK